VVLSVQKISVAAGKKAVTLTLIGLDDDSQPFLAGEIAV